MSFYLYRGGSGPALHDQRTGGTISGRSLPNHDHDRRYVPQPAYFQPPPDFLEGDTRPACAGLPPEVFFIEGGSNNGVATRAEQGKRVCRVCPLLDECRTWALTVHHQGLWGTWGGMTPAERKKWLREHPGERPTPVRRYTTHGPRT